MDPIYTRSSNTKIYTKEQKRRFYGEFQYYRKELLTSGSDYAIITRALLDSSLISQTKSRLYTHKIIECGNYYQLYEIENRTIKKDKGLSQIEKEYSLMSSRRELIKKVKLKIMNRGEYEKESRETKQILETQIESKNINRSKIELQRLAKTNEEEFRTFITLTFAENVKDIEQANKMFNSFRTYIKRLKSDFKYLCVPEFQKRGAVHYHLLTNINYNDILLLSKEEKKLWNKSSKKWEVGKNIIGWNKGYSLVKDINYTNTNIIGYITKYLTKDIDNRLWGKRRYLYSQNLKKPSIVYLDIDTLYDFSKYVDITNNSIINYESSYKNLIGETIKFLELKKIRSDSK